MDNIYALLNQKVEQYNRPNFIENDPISIPHLFTNKPDIEIVGFWAAMLSWGNRKTIINKGLELLSFMGNSPIDFMKNHTKNDLKPFLNFKHRTFNGDDALYFILFFTNYYKENSSLETAFSRFILPNDTDVSNALIGFYKLFFSFGEHLKRTHKHIATPERHSTCKRLNMFLRWMVRKDNNGVDFGLWNTIPSSKLLCPLDVHVDKVARMLGLIKRPQTDYKTVQELTQNLKKIDANDPVKFDFALFGLGIEMKQK